MNDNHPLTCPLLARPGPGPGSYRVELESWEAKRWRIAREDGSFLVP